MGQSALVALIHGPPNPVPGGRRRPGRGSSVLLCRLGNCSSQVLESPRLQVADLNCPLVPHTHSELSPLTRSDRMKGCSTLASLHTSLVNLLASKWPCCLTVSPRVSEQPGSARRTLAILGWCSRPWSMHQSLSLLLRQSHRSLFPHGLPCPSLSLKPGAQRLR